MKLTVPSGLVLVDELVGWCCCDINFILSAGLDQLMILIIVLSYVFQTTYVVFLFFEKNVLFFSAHFCCTFVPPRVRVTATVKLSAAFFHDESSITIGAGGTKVQ